jgi:hypothetical protein
MELVLALKALWDRRIYVGLGLLIAAGLTAVVIMHSRRETTWVANSEFIVDSQPSAIGDIAQDVNPMIYRATVYANLMTSSAVVDRIGTAAGIPGDEIAVTGPIGTTGQRLQHAASVLPAGGSGYSLQADTDLTQPLIRITARAPTSAAALALATGAATGVGSYVNQIDNSESVPARDRAELRGLGQPTVIPKTTGLKLPLAIGIFLGVSIFWCMLVLFASRFRQSWRLASDELVHTSLTRGAIGSMSTRTTSTTDLDLVDPWDGPPESVSDDVPYSDARGDAERRSIHTTG